MGTKRGRLIEDDDDDEEQRIEMEKKRGRRFVMEESAALLPPEIITHEILSRLPADSAMGCRLISKQWRSLIDHPSFVHTHTRQLISSSSTSNPKKFGNYLIPNSCTSSYGLFFCAQKEYRESHLQFVEYNDGEKLVPELKPSKPITDHPFPFKDIWTTLLITSCNGLVFMGSTKPNYVNDMFVCNPFTREYVNLSIVATTNNEKENQRRRLETSSKGGMAYGFGYLPSTNEYKVVRLYYDDLKKRDGKAEVSVYTLGSGTWRNKGEIPYWVYTQLHPGFFANGYIHWFTHKKKKEIVSFDLVDEEFRVVLPLPPQAPPNHVDGFGVLGGCLCVTRSDKTRCESPKDIWVLNIHTKEKGEKKFSWNKRFSIPWKGITSWAKPHVILKSGKILLHGGSGLISYDPKTGAFNEDRESIFYDPRLKVIPYTKSFVSLKALGEEDAKCFGEFVSLDLKQQQQ